MMIEVLRKSPDLNALNLSIQMTLTYEITDIRPHHIVLLISLTTCLYPAWPVSPYYLVPTRLSNGSTPSESFIPSLSFNSINLGPVTTFVSMSAGFSCPGTQCTVTLPSAAHSLMKGRRLLMCLVLRWKSGFSVRVELDYCGCSRYCNLLLDLLSLEGTRQAVHMDHDDALVACSVVEPRVVGALEEAEAFEKVVQYLVPVMNCLLGTIQGFSKSPGPGTCCMEHTVPPVWGR